MKNILYTFLSLFVICLGCNNQTVSPKLSINQIEMTEKTLNMKFQVQNNLSKPIWLCEDVSIHIPADEITEIEDSTVFIKRKVSAFPDTVYFDQPMIGKYICLKSGELKNFSVNISMFERFMSFNLYKNPPSLSGVNSLDFSVGYIDLELCQSYLKLGRENIENQVGFDRELPLFVKEKHPSTENPEYLYIPNFWEGIKSEKTLEKIKKL